MPKDLMNAGRWTHIRRLQRAAELVLETREELTRMDLEDGVDIVEMKSRLIRQADALLLEISYLKSDS